MNVYDYYIQQNSVPHWVKKFQSVSKLESGKIYYCINTNTRDLDSYRNSYNEFKPNLFRERSKWIGTMPSGQQSDKHRTVPLTTAKLVVLGLDGTYQRTYKSSAFEKFIDLELLESESFLLTYLFLLDNTFNDGQNDFVISTKKIITKLKEKLGDVDIDKYLSSLLNIKDLYKLFHTDAFWIVTFARDGDFIDYYLKSSIEERRLLQDYVTKEQKNKKSKDCIGHKFVSSGSMSRSSFIEEAKILFFSNLLMNNQFDKFEEFIDWFLPIYNQFYPININKIKKFITENMSVFKKSYNEFIKVSNTI